MKTRAEITIEITKKDLEKIILNHFGISKKDVISLMIVGDEDTYENTNPGYIEIQFNRTYIAKPLPKVDLQ